MLPSSTREKVIVVPCATKVPEWLLDLVGNRQADLRRWPKGRLEVDAAYSLYLKSYMGKEEFQRVLQKVDDHWM
jgi:hypothetical protein